MNTFEVGDRIIFRESTEGEPEPGVVTEVIPADEDYPNGGLYIIRTDEPGPNGHLTEAWVDELIPEPEPKLTCPSCGADMYVTGEIAIFRVCTDNPTHVFHSHL